MKRTTVRPHTVSRDDDDLRCKIRRTFGYLPQCECGWRGHTWRSVRDARLEASFHECDRAAA